MQEKEQLKITEDIDVTPEEIRVYFKGLADKKELPEIPAEVQIAQLVLKAEPTKEENDRVINKLKEIKKQVENGASFKLKAIINSDDPSAAQNSGNMGVITKETGFVKEFKEVAFSLEEGQISEPFKSPFGYHIVLLNKIRGNGRDVSHILIQPEIADEKLKETKGKFEGARYCYLGRHAEIRNDADEELINLESALDDLVRFVDHKETVFARQTIKDALILICELDSKFLENLTAVRMYALESGKYTVESYKERISVNLLLDAAARHFLKYIYISKLDEESGVTHLAHIAANLIMIDTQINEWML